MLDKVVTNCFTSR